MYEIIGSDIVVGTAQVKKEGLYYRFICNCTPPDKAIYRIYVSDGVNQWDLGICVPEDDGFVLKTRVPAKFFKIDNFSFSLIPVKSNQTLTPVETDKPFEELEKLKTARFLVENGQPGIVIDPVPNQPGSDQNLECPHKFP